MGVDANPNDLTEMLNHPTHVRMLTLRDLQSIIHRTAVLKGWWETERHFPEALALMHSELSEALEAYRADEPTSLVLIDGKPEGVAVELADCIIRILDWAGRERIDMQSVLVEKMRYNLTRPYRHGGKKA